MDDPMNDSERLTALFRDAASDTDAPPPRFGHDDVLAASRRITARRRSAAIGAAAVIGLAGLGAAIVLPGSGETLTSAAAPVSAPEAARDAAGGATAGEEAGSAQLPSPYAAEPGSGSDLDSGPDPSSDPRDSAGDGSGPGTGSGDEAGSPAPSVAVAPVPVLPPLGPGSGPCADRQDAALRALVEQVLPGLVDAQPAPTTDVCLPGAERYLALEATDGGARGVLTVGYLPPGTVAALAPGTLSAPTASGGTVLVGSTAEGAGPAPFADRLQDLLGHLAPRL